MSQPPDLPTPLVFPERPTLDPVIVADDDDLAEAVDQFILQDRVGQERLADVNRHVEYLRAILDAEVWRLFLQVEEETNARWADLSTKIAIWAFLEGQKHPLRPATEEATPDDRSGEPPPE